MSARKPLPRPLVGQAFTRRQAVELHVTPSRLRAKDLSRPFHGVRAAGARLDEIEQLCRAYQKRMLPGLVFSNVTAARLYGLPLPLYATRDTRLHVSARVPTTPPKGKGVAGHKLAPECWATRSLIHHDYRTGDLAVFPVVDPTVVWAELAANLDLDDLVSVGDAIVGSDDPLCTVSDLEEIVSGWAGRRGAKTMAMACGRVRVGALSRPESLLRLQLLRAGFPEPQLNMMLTDARQRPLYRADISWPEFRVLIEYEGDGHRTSRTKFRTDITRGEEYADGEWFSMRASADDVFVNPNPLMARVARRLRAQGWSPSREIVHIAGARW